MYLTRVVFGVFLLGLVSLPVRAALQGYSPLYPSSLISVPDRVEHVLISELETGKLHIYSRNGDDLFALNRTMEVSIGKSGFGKQVEGDNKTPVGVYRITSHLNKEQLDDFYGEAAYPINYPNSWDRLQDRTGYGIWLHAEPLGYVDKTRPLYDSNGCVVLSNRDIQELVPFLNIGYTPVVLTPRMNLTSGELVARRKAEVKQVIDRWVSDWETLKPGPYLAHYSRDFASDDRNWQQWVAYKKRINSRKSFIRIGISDLGIYEYPGEEGHLLVEFYQSYRSSNFNSRGWKRLMLRKEQGEWKIVYEGGG